MVGAMVSSILAGDPQALSLRSCFPNMWEMETQHGGLVRALVARRRERRPDVDVGLPRGRLTSFSGGMEDLVRALVASLGTRVRTGTPVTALRERAPRVSAIRSFA